MHDASGCGFYRVTLPLGELGRHGHDVQTWPGWSEAARDYSIIVGQRMDKHDALPIWRRLKATSRLVYEIDDDVFSVEPVNWMAHRVYSKPVPQDTVIHAAQVADMVTVTTEPLAEVMRAHNPNTVVLPNHIPAGLLDIERPRRDKVVIGWAGGASHGLDIAEVAQPLRRVLDRDPHVEVHLIGTDYSPTVKRQCRFTKWSDDPWDYYRSIDFDIGLAPLTYSTFNRSKSHIKALEYAALGIPVVATDSEPYRDLVVDGVSGFLIRRPHEWEQRIRDLVNDSAMRTEMGIKAREVASRWTVEDGWRLWESAYEGVSR
jgi:glycosyltransferase involved in cell wall biosynthesis